MDKKRKKYRIVSTTINHIARERLGLSNDEMVLCDLVFKLSHQRPCNLSREKQAAAVGVTVRGVQKMIKRMIEKGLFEQNAKYELWTTQKYVDAILLADEEKDAYFRGEQSSPLSKNTDEQSSPPPRTKFTPPPEQSSPYTNNIDTNKDIVCVGENENYETHTQKNENSISEKEEPTSLKSETKPAKEVPAVDVATSNAAQATESIDYRKEAFRHIKQAILNAPAFQREVWKKNFSDQIRLSGKTAGTITNECVDHILNNDRILQYLDGPQLLREVKALPPRRYITFYEKKWLPNVRAAKQTA